MTFKFQKSLALTTLFLSSAMLSSPTVADRDTDDFDRSYQPFTMKFAGAFVQSLVQEELKFGQPTGVFGRRSIAWVKSRGSLGRSDIVAVTIGGPPISPATCPAGLVKIADIVEDNIVQTFDDLSILYGDGTGVVCLNPADPTADLVVEVNGVFLGGTGRFRGADGKFTLRFGLNREISPNTQFIAEDGVMTGHVKRQPNYRKDD